MKVLVAIPYHEAKRYALDHLFDWINKATLPDTDIVLRVHKGIYGEKDAVKTQREFSRLLALNGGYSHLLFVGVDTIPPLDVLPRFLAHNTDVVGGVYYGRKGQGTAVAWRHDTKPEDLVKQFDGKLLQVDGMGMDCVLFTRKALENMSWSNYPEIDDDYPLYDMLTKKGFTIYLDTSIICKHYATKETYA